MSKSRRSERMVVITRLLTQRPRNLFSLNYFSESFSAAKSTISEDLTIMRDACHKWGLGEVVTIPGAAGGSSLCPSKIVGKPKN